MSSDKRFTKKQIKEDKLVKTAFRTSQYIQKNPTAFIAGGIVLAVIFAAVLLFIWSSDKKKEESITLLARGRIAMESGQPEAGMGDLETLIKDHAGSEAAGIGAMILANYYYRNMEYDKALTYFEIVVSDYSGEKMMIANASSGAAACYEIAGNRAEAARYYRMAADSFPDRIWAPDQLKWAFYNYLAIGDTTTAISVIKELNSLYENTPEAIAAKRTLAEITY